MRDRRGVQGFRVIKAEEKEKTSKNVQIEPAGFEQRTQHSPSEHG